MTTAQVEVLQAEVRCLMVGKRQVTLSVYRQLDSVWHEDCEAFGRVRDSQDKDSRAVYVVGRHRDTGALIRSSRESSHPAQFNRPTPHAISIMHFQRIGSSSLPPVVQIASRDGYEVNWKLRPSYEYVRPDYKAEPEGETWTFASDDVRNSVQEDADELISVALEEQKEYEEWNSLPLIVLAGLR